MDSALQPASSGLQINRMWLRAWLPWLHLARAQLRLRGGRSGGCRQTPAGQERGIAATWWRFADAPRPPEGGALNPLEQMKRGANIFQAFCRGDSTSVDGKREASTPNMHTVKSVHVQPVWERISLHIHTNIQKNSKNSLKGLTRDLQSCPSIMWDNKRRRGLLFYCSRPLECNWDALTTFGVWWHDRYLPIISF